jgi:hypothetical protein
MCATDRRICGTTVKIVMIDEKTFATEQKIAGMLDIKAVPAIVLRMCVTGGKTSEISERMFETVEKTSGITVPRLASATKDQGSGNPSGEQGSTRNAHPA